MENFAKPGDEKEIIICCDPEIAGRLYEGICQIFAEYPRHVSDEWRREKRELARLKGQIEGLLPREFS